MINQYLPIDVLQNILLPYLIPIQQNKFKQICKEYSNLKYRGINKLMVKYIDDYLKYPIGQKLMDLMKKYNGKIEIYGSILLKVLYADKNLIINDLDLAVTYNDDDNILINSEHFIHKDYALGIIDSTQREISLLNYKQQQNHETRKQILALSQCRELYNLINNIPTIKKEYGGVHPSYGIHDSYFKWFKSDTYKRLPNNEYFTIGETSTSTPHIYDINVSIQYVPEKISVINSYSDEITLTSNSFNGNYISTKYPTDVISKIGYTIISNYKRAEWYYSSKDLLRRLHVRAKKYMEKGFDIRINRKILKKYINFNNIKDIKNKKNNDFSVMDIKNLFNDCRF